MRLIPKESLEGAEGAENSAGCGSSKNVLTQSYAFTAALSKRALPLRVEDVIWFTIKSHVRDGTCVTPGISESCPYVFAYREFPYGEGSWL